MDAYIDHLPKEIPVAVLQSAAGSVGLSLLWGEPIKKTAERIYNAVGVVALNSFVSTPIAGYLFSKKSAQFRDTSSLAISLLVLVGLARLKNEDFRMNFSASSIVLSFIFNAKRKPDEAATFV